jgi:DNA-directed RNA polymerase specialized sigma24 family protein
LSYYGGLSVQEIAAQIGEPESGTSELLRSAMNDLRSALAPMGTFQDQAMTRA